MFIACLSYREINMAQSSCYASEFSCAICMGLMVEPTTLTCGHSFCRHCLAKWYLTIDRKTCAQCRQIWSGNPQVNVTIRYVSPCWRDSKWTSCLCVGTSLSVCSLTISLDAKLQLMIRSKYLWSWWNLKAEWSELRSRPHETLRSVCAIYGNTLSISAFLSHVGWVYSEISNLKIQNPWWKRI